MIGAERMPSRQALDKKTRTARKEAGYVSVMCHVPPALAVEMDALRGTTPRSRWLIEQVLDARGLEVAELGRKSGRPRTRGLSLPVPLEPVTYRPVALREIASRIRARPEVREPLIARGDLGDGSVGLWWPRFLRFGRYDPYDAVKRAGATWDRDLGVWRVSPDLAD